MCTPPPPPLPPLIMCMVYMTPTLHGRFSIVTVLSHLHVHVYTNTPREHTNINTHMYYTYTHMHNSHRHKYILAYTPVIALYYRGRIVHRFKTSTSYDAFRDAIANMTGKLKFQV